MLGLHGLIKLKLRYVISQFPYLSIPIFFSSLARISQDLSFPATWICLKTGLRN